MSKRQTNKRPDYKSKKDNKNQKVSKHIELDGVILEALPSTTFKVQLDNGMEILCNMAGKLRMFYIKLIPGDRVKVEMSPYDLTKGRISYRYK